MTRIIAWVALAVGVAASSCGDGNGPTAPTGEAGPPPAPPPAGAVLTILAGVTQQPVPGALVKAGGAELTANASGQVTIEGGLSEGANVDVLASGFFDRQTKFRGPSETELTLWPRTHPNGLTEDLTRRLVYTATRDGAEPGALPMRRPSVQDRIVIVPEAAIRNSPQAMRVVENAAAVLRSALAGRMAVEITDGGGLGGGVEIEILIDPDVTSSDFVGRWQRFVRGNTVTSARLTFRSLQRLIDNDILMTHNLGHAIGLNHSPERNDRMAAEWWMRRRNDFSDKEVLVIRLVFERRPGTTFPDNDRDADANMSRTQFVDQGTH